MAKHTVEVTISDSWTALSAGETTVIAQKKGPESIRIAVADAPVDLTIDDGHDLHTGATFFGLGANVYARTTFPEQTAKVTVTRY